MYAKIFAQIFESSIAEDYIARHVFMDLLVLADEDGVVDKTPQAISRITNVPLDFILHGLEVLGTPDEKSRTKLEGGRRIVLIDEGRDWGWRIVNYGKYRQMRDEEARRIANRSYKRDQRQRDRAAGLVETAKRNTTRAHHNAVRPISKKSQLQMRMMEGTYFPPSGDGLGVDSEARAGD